MDLTWTEEEEAFRAEARGWLGAHLDEWHDRIGGHPLSGDTAEGFQQHLVWERMLFEDKWAVVSWPLSRAGSSLLNSPGTTIPAWDRSR